MAKLILVRHGKSEWNELGKWTGRTDVKLVDQGREEARQAGTMVCDIDVGCAYVSSLTRAQQTLEEMRKALGKDELPVTIHGALDERDYGVHTGKNKWEVKEQIGEEEFQKIRRGWDTPIEGGETLKDVHDRVVPYYEENILSELKQGRNVLVVAHGNTLRALMKHLEGLDEAQVCEVEVGTGEVHCYDVDDEGKVTEKEVRVVNENKAKV